MPIYEYMCENCQSELEAIQKISDAPLTVCPSCSAPSLKKKTSISAFHLKGAGWYKDGYQTAGTNGSSTDVKPAKAVDAPVEKGKPETTPAASEKPAPASKPVDPAPKTKAS